MTTQTLTLLELMMTAPAEWWYSLQLARQAGLKTGTTSPILARLEKAGWLESEFERIDPSREKRPRRRLYRLTGLGERAARARLLEAEGLQVHSRRVREPQAPSGSLPRGRPA